MKSVSFWLLMYLYCFFVECSDVPCYSFQNFMRSFLTPFVGKQMMAKSQNMPRALYWILFVG